LGLLKGLLSKRAKRGVLAIQVKDGGCCAALVIRSPGSRPRLIWYEELASEHPQAWSRLLRRYDVRNHRCTALIPRSQYQVLLLEAPQIPAHELKAAMRWRIKDMIDYHVDDAVIDVLDIPPERDIAGRHFMFAVAAHGGQVQNLVRRMEAARVPVEVIDIPDIAQRNIAALLETPHEAAAMLTLTDDGGLLTINYGGELYMTRRIELTLSALQKADEETRSSFLERIVLEVQRSLDHFERQFRTLPLTKVLLGPLPEPFGLQAALQSAVEARVEIFDLEAVIDCGNVPTLANSATQNRSLHCLGAALRLEESRL
jgi:MSHA biogenesis protein MshI